MCQCSRSLIANGHYTDILVKPYSDRILVIITQFKKFGTLLTINCERSLDGRDVSYAIKVLFGNDNNDITVAARYLAEQFDAKKPILLSIALKDYNIETLKSIAAVVSELKAHISDNM